ncbi:MAG: ATP-binding protein [Pseudoxanthomonas sp.]
MNRSISLAARIRKAAAWLCLLMPWITAPALAGMPETPMLRQLSVVEGLPSNIVYDIAEDAEGYLWFATIDGLARYDGAGFRVWRREDGLGDNEVLCVFVDAGDRVWAGTESGGLAMIGADRRQVRRFDRMGDLRLDASPIWDVARTPDGSLWVGTAGKGLYRARADGVVEHFLPGSGDPRSVPGATITTLEVAADGTLWVGADEGAARWTGRDFQRLPLQAPGGNYAMGLMIDHAGDTWVRSIPAGGVQRKNGRWDARPWHVFADDRKEMVFGPLLQDNDGAYWLHTTQGLIRYQDGVSHPASLYSNLTRGMATPQFERALADSDGGLWFASRDSGVWHLPSNWRQFSVQSKDSPEPLTLGNAQVLAAAASASGKIWLVGTSGTLDVLDPEAGTIRHAGRTDPIRVFSSVLEDVDGKVWIGYSDGMARLDPATGKAQHWTRDSLRDPALSDDMLAIAQDGDGRIWTWSQGAGVQVRTPAGQVIENIGLGDGRGLQPGLMVKRLWRGADGKAWLAGSQGLLAWNAQGRRFDPVPGAPADAVDGFDQATDGTVWIAHFGAVEGYRFENGALKLDKRIAAEAGLPQIAFKGITVDRDGILWVASNRGLIRVDPVQATTRIYGIGDGLPGQEIAFAPVAGGGVRLLVAAAHGVAVFDPAALRPPSRVPRLAVDSIAVRRGGDVVALPVDAPFRIGNDDRDLRVAARLLSFDNVAGNRYRFRLSGFDDDWVDVGGSGERTFSRLPPGDYRLEIAGRTADNLWSETKTIVFHVDPPWWRTWWALAAYAVLGVLLLLTVAAAYRRRVRRRSAWQLAEHKRELAEQASLAKTRFLATLGHEVRTPMTGVLGMSELLLGTPLDEKQRGYTTAIQNAGKHLLRLVNDALDLARIESGKLELESQDFDLRELVADVAGLVAPMAQQRGLDFDCWIDPAAPRILRGDPLRVRQILLNLLNNALKFTEHGSVGLQALPRAGGGVRFTVSDTGPGINPEQQARLFQRFEQAEGARTAARYGGSGLGLAICQELAVAMGGHVDLHSTPGVGTRFVVNLPLPSSQDAAVPASRGDAAETAPATTHPLRILLVEDDPTVAEVVASLLRVRGHAVYHAAHGLAALAEVAGGDGFDIALLDLDLPGLDGLALARQLRAQGFVAPLLAVTARADADAEPMAKEAGFDGFLRKPVTGEMLEEAMRSLRGGE